MIELRKSLMHIAVTILLAACRAEQTEEIGKVQDCGNGQQFNLRTGECRLLAGHQMLLDRRGFERISLKNGLIVPRSINGKTPFTVSFAYDVSRATAFDIVLKKVEGGSMGGDNYSDWRKVWVEAGKGVATVRLFPKDNKPIETGRAANYLEGRWLNEDGYAIELKGGDRFENEDADRLEDWRVAGVAVDEEAADDPEGKLVLLGEFRIKDPLASCGVIEGTIEVLKTEIDLDLIFGLKEPGSNWRSWGGYELNVPAGREGTFEFRFDAKDGEGRCAPPGGKVQFDPWYAPSGNYLVQLDIFDAAGEKIKFDQYLYKGVRDAVGVEVLAAEQE